MINKKNEIEDLLAEHSPDIMILSETFAHEAEAKNTVYGEYKHIACYGRDSATNRGGGVIILAKDINNFEIQEYDIKQYTKQHIIEACCAKITNCRSKQILFLIGIYRPPPVDSLDEFFVMLYNLLLAIHDRNSKIIIAGDYNIDCMEDTKSARELQSILKTFNITI